MSGSFPRASRYRLAAATNDLNSAIGYLRLFKRAILNEIDSSTTSLASRSCFESTIGSPHPLDPLSLESAKHNVMSGWIDAYRKEFQRTRSLNLGNFNFKPVSVLLGCLATRMVANRA